MLVKWFVFAGRLEARPAHRYVRRGKRAQIFRQGNAWLCVDASSSNVENEQEMDSTPVDEEANQNSIDGKFAPGRGGGMVTANDGG